MFSFLKKTYSIKKDAKLENTLSLIRDIFYKLNFDITEGKFLNYTDDKSAPSSLRISIKNTFIGANGKGKTPLAALCSAYAELIERLQTVTSISIKNSQFVVAPDEKHISVSQYFCEHYDYLKESFILSNVYGNVSDDVIKESLNIISDMTSSYSDIKNDEKKIVCVPFYDVFNDVVEYLPWKYLQMKNITNGFSAGNTKEEALVQCLSEVFERYAEKQIIFNDIVLPVVPEKYYRKFSEINKIIKFLEKAGYTVVVKDASIDKKLPVVMTVFIDNKTKKVSYRMGSHPDFVVAVERTLTEFLQGFPILNDYVKKILALKSCIESYEENVYKEQILSVGMVSHLDNNHPFVKVLLSNDSSYRLNLDYILMRKNLNNKQMLKEMIHLVKSFSSKFYVRDFNFLGFETLAIEIPTMSQMQLRLFEIIKHRVSYEKFVQFLKTMNMQNKISVDDIIVATTQVQFLYYDWKFYFVHSVPNIFISAIAYIEKGDKNKAIECLNVVLEHNKIFVKYLPMVEELKSVLICDKQLSEIEDENIRSMVQNYLSAPLDTLWNFVEQIKREYSINDDNELETIEIDKVKNILISKYIENTPKQENLRNFFNEILNQE